MFDHSNPSGFQQIFHYLLQLLHKDKSNQEFRDCWPILDKKQEADFRRRVASMIKDFQKDHPDELPYCNPSIVWTGAGYIHDMLPQCWIERLISHLLVGLSKKSYQFNKLQPCCFRCNSIFNTSWYNV